ncbi:MAG: HD domain-containing protein [Candidatus Omnitrophica bacterium]|nr:HD domain-containing protein [Candidatus Omnitrophota bacterium]MBU4467940.1 HD domain-containing protein [Candidatus Omnitrophota bacterium]MCG2708593.1 HD domain-containing protein [Candidatus Omnitrophota bacterium]
MTVQERYEALKSKVTKRKNEFDTFINMLEKGSSWLTSPASTKYHLNKAGGLLEHSVGVTETLLKFRETLAPAISEESCVIVGLLHDVGKIGMPGKPRYLKNDNQWEIEKRNMTYKINPDEVYMNLATRSLYLIAKYISLSDSEAQAILYHDGQYVEGNKEVAHHEMPITLLVHFADMWTATVYEEGRKIVESTDYYDKKD